MWTLAAGYSPVPPTVDIQADSLFVKYNEKHNESTSFIAV
jgi:hypothetical protein